MAISRRTIFREKALKHYLNSQEEMVLPRFILPPVMLVLWCLLILLLVSVGLTWFYRIPIFLTAAGEVSTHTALAHQIDIVLVIPADRLPELHAGLPVQLQLGEDGPIWQQKLTLVEPGVWSHAEIRNRFGLDGVAAILATQPSAVALLQAPMSLPLAASAGSIVQARIQVGTQRVISFFPGLGSLGGK